ncbi:hypothetical protein CERSUDRAFT_77415 [Gelatoporia subvermispora B]|uniref:Uncharacterized protein n=1 Tax=Ceriporiopsis subvermispora (strain B) TaxID=914234 RepID=M2QJV6_CERS8|nr:hypothetical protein CERSUDRAFT_77415 [Gelatoporia subvermispora B]
MSAGSHLDNTLGAIQIASILSSVVFGVTILQTYTYFHRGSSDPTLFKAAIGLISALGVLHEIITSYTSYIFMVTDFGKPIENLHMTWSTDVLVIISSVMNTCNRFIFILRIWRLSREWIPAVVIAVFSIGELAPWRTGALMGE